MTSIQPYNVTNHTYSGYYIGNVWRMKLACHCVRVCVCVCVCVYVRACMCVFYTEDVSCILAYYYPMYMYTWYVQRNTVALKCLLSTFVFS